MMDLRIFICGRLALENGQTILLERDFPGRQARRLWAYLVLNRRLPVARDTLAEAVWGDNVPDAWDSSLNALVSRLRTLLRLVTLEESALEIQGDVGRYRLSVPHGAFVDADRARAALHAAETARRSGDVETALGEARVAVEIAARGFLGGESGAWIEGQRRSLYDTQVHALECTVEAELCRGNPERAEREAELLIALDPLRESGYRLRMRAVAAGGDTGAAVRVMDDCRRALRTAAGLTPSPETERLFRALTSLSS